MRVMDLRQDGEAWHEWRAQGVGASDAASILGKSPWTPRKLLLHQKATGTVVPENEAMARGKRLEPVARLAYQELTGRVSPPACVVHDTHPWLRASLDGLSQDTPPIGLEIKCPGERSHRTAAGGQVPTYYLPQVHYQMLVTGLAEWDFFSYNPDLPGLPACALIRVHADPDYQAALLKKVKRFWDDLGRARKRIAAGEITPDLLLPVLLPGAPAGRPRRPPPAALRFRTLPTEGFTAPVDQFPE